MAMPPAMPPLMALPREKVSQRKLRAVRLVHFDARDFLDRREEGDELFLDDYILVRLVREDVAKPSDDGDDGQKQAESPDDEIGHQRGGDQRDSQGKQKRPRRGRGQMHGMPV